MKQQISSLSSITLLSLVVGIFLTLGGLSFSFNLRNILLKRQEVYMLEIAERANRDFTAYVEREMKTLKAISSVFADFYSYSSLDDYLLILEDINRYNAFQHTGIVFINSNKTAYFENGEKVYDFIPQEMLNKALKGESSISNLVPDPITKEPVIVYTTPFVINGRTEAVIFATQTVTDLQKILEHYKISGEGFVVVLNKKDQVIIHTEDDVPLPTQNLKQLLSLIGKDGQEFYKELISSLNKDDSGLLGYTVKNTKQYRLLSFVKISVLGLQDWHLIFVVPADAISALRKQIFLVSLIFFSLNFLLLSSSDNSFMILVSFLYFFIKSSNALSKTF